MPKEGTMTTEKKLTNTQRIDKALQDLSDSERYDFNAVIEKMGGAEYVIGLMRHMEDVRKRMDKARPSLLEKYPDKWIAWGEDGVVAVADTHEELLAIIHPMGLGTWDVETDYLDTEPKVYIF